MNSQIYRTDVIAKGDGGWGWIDRESRISRCKLLYAGWVNDKVLLHSTGNYMDKS